MSAIAVMAASAQPDDAYLLWGIAYTVAISNNIPERNIKPIAKAFNSVSFIFFHPPFVIFSVSLLHFLFLPLSIIYNVLRHKISNSML